jgi:hypothetical protein
MTILQLTLLFVVSAPFCVALWIAFLHRSPAAPCGGTGLGLIDTCFTAESLDLEAEARAAADAAIGLARENFVRIRLAVKPGTNLRVEPEALRTALRTIVDTAVRATPGGQVLLTGMVVGTQVHVRVVDDGVKTDQALRESLVREAGSLIALQGGSIAVETRPGQGTTVTIRLSLPGESGAEVNDFVQEPVLAVQAA